jgi:hypothetical protein
LNDATWAVIGPLTVATEAGLSHSAVATAAGLNHPESAVSVESLSRVLKIVLDGIRAVPVKGETC